ncbi:MAG TPA: hypothetical protein V6D28_00450 [Leptolyngbyaceae cyanobacterium]
MGGVVYIWEKEGRPQIEAAKAKENLIFDFQEKDVQSVLLKTKNLTLQFDKNIQNQKDRSAPKWLLKILENTPATATEQAKDSKPTPSPEAKPTEQAKDSKSTPSPEAKPTDEAKERKELAANEAYVSYLLNLLAKSKGDRIIADPRIEDGLDNPLATVEVKLNNKQTHQLILGNSNFNNTSLYALADPPQQLEEPLKLVLVPTDFKYAVDRPLSEWQQEEQQKQSTTQNTGKSSSNSSQKDDKEKYDKGKTN